MKQEIFNKENNQYLDELRRLYEQNKKLLEGSSLPNIIMRLFINKEKEFEFKVAQPPKKEDGQAKYPGKYLVEIIWDEKETTNGNTFCKAFLVIPEAKENKIIISASKDIEIEKEKFNDEDFIMENLLRAFENPIQRSSNPFYEAKDPPLLDDKDKIERIETETIEYRQSSSFLNKKEFLARLEKASGKVLIPLFKKITDVASRELCDFETKGDNQEFSGTKIKGISREKQWLGFRPLITLNFLPETGDVFLKFFPQAKEWKWDLIIFTNIKNDSGIDYKLKLLDGDKSDYAGWLRNILSSLAKVKNFSRTSA